MVDSKIPEGDPMTNRVLQPLFWLAVSAFLVGMPADVAIADEDQVVHVDIRKGKAIRLPKSASGIFVADPEVADVQLRSPQFLYILGKRAGETSLLVVDGADKEIYSATISVTHNLRRLNSAIKQLMPDEEVVVTSLDRSVVLSGRVSSANQAEDVRRLAATFIGEDTDLINRLEIMGPTQINLRVRIAEVSREISKEIGVNWEMVVNNAAGATTFGLASGRNFLLPGGSFLNIPDGPSSIGGGFSSGNLDFNVLMDLLETEGLVTTLAQPNLTALSGETANFLAGGEFPIPVPQDDGAITITFKQFGVGLAFTPSILDSGLINLKVIPEVSALSDNGAVSLSGFSVPALTTRRAETTVELASGQSLVIAGLLRNGTVRALRKVPGLSDIPILGPLFNSDRFQREESELVIVVTPYLVKPVSDRQIALPTDGYVNPEDTDRLLRGASYRREPIESVSEPRGGNSRKLTGPAGFELN